MKIAIDISAVVYGTGVSAYTRNLVKNLLKIDKENEYTLFGGSLRRRGELRDFVNTLQVSTFKGKLFPIPPTLADLIWNRLHILPIELFTGRIDIFHSSDWTQPPSSAFKVTTVHDLVPLKFPELSHPRIVAAHKTRLKWVKKEVDRIIVPSETTKKDLITLGEIEGRIKVIPETPDAIFRPAKVSEVNKLKKAYKISGKYLLSIGITPRKNTERIIAAYERIRVGDKPKLVIIGEPKIKIKVKGGVKFLGHVPHEELPAFYSGAEALVYPSLYEGFGLPILEAFSCKTPVITSNLGSLREIAGGAAVLVDPNDIDSIVEGIKKALRGRRELVESGVKRVKKFSWKKTAKETLNVYKEARN